MITRSTFSKLAFMIGRPDITEEAIAAGEEARNYEISCAIRIQNVSRVFRDDKDKPILAVNDVSLGIRQGSLFGFLGANGAGKTTMMKMIAGEIPPSAGVISVEGGVAICPQFNSHLTNEMTIAEHFKFFSYIFGRSPDATAAQCQELVHELMLEDHIDKPVGNLSGGNARKLAIAIALMSPARVVLLDEPTSSLDPLARHAAQKLLNSVRGEKTMMLCTHLLSEAEELCDTIGVMLRGSVYVVGSPQYLSAKYGTEWRLDVLFSQETDGQFQQFLAHQLPSSKLVIHRPANQIYAIPSCDIPMLGLFRLMDTAISMPELAVKFFTASSASLEKVFLELVMKSDAAGDRTRAFDGPAI
jgi:ABC-type multidrug transport system ATPase subunit